MKTFRHFYAGLVFVLLCSVQLSAQPTPVSGGGSGGSADPAEAIHTADAKTTPADADEFGYVDSEAANVLKQFTWANLKTALKTYFDSLSTTLTNKRITPRIATLTDAATVTPATDAYDGGILTTLSQTTDFLNPTGTPTDGQRYTLRIKSSTTRTITWTNGGSGTQYRGSADLALPSATSGSSLTDYLVFIWNAADSKWDLVGRTFGF